MGMVLLCLKQMFSQTDVLSNKTRRDFPRVWKAVRRAHRQLVLGQPARMGWALGSGLSAGGHGDTADTELSLVRALFLLKGQEDAEGHIPWRAQVPLQVSKCSATFKAQLGGLSSRKPLTEPGVLPSSPGPILLPTLPPGILYFLFQQHSGHQCHAVPASPAAFSTRRPILYGPWPQGPLCPRISCLHPDNHVYTTELHLSICIHYWRGS